MSTISDLKMWLETGNEVEFSYNSKEYSITYGNDASMGEYISLCEFYKDETKYNTVSDFLDNAKIGEILLRDIWSDVSDVIVY